MSRTRSGGGGRKKAGGPRVEVQTKGPANGAATDGGAGLGVPGAPAPFPLSGSTTASGTASTAAYRRVAMSEARKGIGVGAFLLAVVTAGALAHVAVRIKGLEVAYALGHERKVATDLEEQRRRLQIEIGMLKDPGRVVQFARDKLKMGPPAPDAIVALAAASSLTNTAPPAPLAPLKGSAGAKSKPAKAGGR